VGETDFGLLANKVSKIQGRNPSFKTPVCRIYIYSSQGIDYDKLRTQGLAGKAKLPAPGSTEQLYAIVGRDGYLFYTINPSGTYEKLSLPLANRWQVLDCRVNLTRQWNCSSASFQLAEYQPDPKFRSIPPIAPNDVIVIKMGYASSPFVPICKADGVHTEDEKLAWLDTVFYGIVDSVVNRGGSTENDGFVFTVKARDAMKLLSDTKITRVFNYSEPAEGVSTRTRYVKDLIYTGSVVSNFQLAQKDVEAANSTGNPSTPDLATSTLVEPGEESSYYRQIWVKESTRADVIATDKASGMFGAAVIDKYPLQIIKYISSMENEPTEVWADNRTGDIYWQKRVTDFRCLLNSPLSRQYVYAYPQQYANVLSFQNEWSSIGVITQHIIHNPINNLDAQNVSNGYVAIAPWSVLKDNHNHGRRLRPMTSTRYIPDNALQSSQNDVNQDRTALALALSTIYGRCIESGTLQVEGDPTLDVGEAIQFYSAGLLGRFSKDGQLDNRATLEGLLQPNSNNPDPGEITGIYRIEALSHLFAVGGVKRGYTTSFIFGPLGRGASLSLGTENNWVFDEKDLSPQFEGENASPPAGNSK
jgi:hypothetical protein